MTTQASRFSTVGALLISALLVAACGGTPDVVSGVDQPSAGTSSGGSSGNGVGGNFDPINTGGDSSGGKGNNGDAGSPDTGPTCGDGKLDAPETCDDGNGTPGDGCDGNCVKAANWDCPTPGEKCIEHPVVTVCGDGKAEGTETCDLGKSGNVSLNDGKSGCDADCKTVVGWTCPGDAKPCTKDLFCGDSIVSNTLGEECDDGTNDGAHGCSPLCTGIVGWQCPFTGGPCTVDANCGNGKVDSGEQCDDHNLYPYDGCTPTCLKMAGWNCPATGGTCTQICGNGTVDPGEACDDSNSLSGDGCSDTCSAIATNYTCAVAGQPCVYTPPPPGPQCGNGKLETGETCDDGNPNGGDGCSSVCALESGWKCDAPNAACVAKQCGDGILAGTEKCDDGIVNTTSGCTPTCTIAPNAICPANGGACVPMKCGDGKVTGTETCDNGVNDGKKGCSATCQLITGWVCPLAGTQCSEVCGDGVVVGTEQCDEKGDVACCSASCKVKSGFVCDPSKTPHSQPSAPYCGNNTVNGPSNANSTVLGSEQCDDGNKLPFDGCSPTCTNEPLCGTKNTYLTNPPDVTYQCFAHCGDGLVLPPEQCDDGNATPGDGCDSNCKVELVPNTTNPAWTCVQPAAGTSLTLPVVWRDFSPQVHPQFSIDPRDNRRLPGIAQNSLKPVTVSANGVFKYKYVPAYNTGFASPNFGSAFKNIANWTMNGPGWVAGSEGFAAPPWMVNPPAYDKVWYADHAATLTNGNANVLLTPAGRFAQWYVDDATANRSFASTITLKGVGAAFQYSCDSAACDSTFPGNPSGFFPIDNQGWITEGKEAARDGGHNYSFTTEMRSWFGFKGGEQLAFFGDDDLWVFINGQLALDIGGIHSKVAGNFTLNNNGSVTTCVQDLPDNNPLNCTTTALGLVVGQVYEIAIFNAEREVTQSNFQLTLQGFNNAPSVCTPICGDGYAAGSEQCDRGNLNVPPTGNTYGQCTTECKLGPFCGDSKPLIPPEKCDNGLNIDAYVTATPGANMCAPGCFLPTYCGDAVLQKANGEECDNGTANNQNAYGKCQTNCRLGARCGDGSTQTGAGEECDAGPNNGSLASNCDATCKLKCGNGKPDAGEECDLGTAGNSSPTSKCTVKCLNKCGNGEKDTGEQCDDGKNDGSYNTCQPDCTFAARCGDMVVQMPPEACDNGASNVVNAYGPNSCTDRCLPGGQCGDGKIQSPEKCDDGKNTGMPGSCKPDCSAYVPSTLCGDGKIQVPEKCDDGGGANGNGSATSKCDTACRFKCGNAFVDAGETCDNGVNDGAYGTCTATCGFAAYCGDSIKNGNEQCDKGAQNLKDAYGTGVCTTTCKAAPFCGDGFVQSLHGEECEGNDNCLNCKSTIIK